MSSHSSVTGSSRLRGSTPSTYGYRVATRSVASSRTNLLFPAVYEQDIDAWEAFFESFDPPPHLSDSPKTNWTDRCKSCLSHARHLTSITSKDTR